jgi:hypothetical protein
MSTTVNSQTDGLGAGAASITVSNGVLVAPYGSSPPLTSAALAGRPAPRGRRIVLMGGSETARGQQIRSIAAGNVVCNFSTQTITITFASDHGYHSGAKIFLASEQALAPGLNGGIITVDNMFAYGVVTVVSATVITIPYWVANTGTIYATLNGTSTVPFVVMSQDVFSANSKFQEMNRWQGFTFQMIANLGTGSNNTSNLVERVPALVYMAKNRMFDELRGTLGVGNTLLYGQNHSWTPTQMVTQVIADVTTVCTAMAQFGISTELELPPYQANSTGTSVGGTYQVIEALYKLAADPSLRIQLVDEMSATADPATGLVRNRYRRNGTDTTHPSNEACVYEGRNHAEISRGQWYPSYNRRISSINDSYFADNLITVQYFDPMSSTTPTVAASGLESRSTGQVPDLVTNIVTTGATARNIVFSYEQLGERWYLVATLSAGGVGDTFQIDFTNKAGSRNLATILNGLGGHTFKCDAHFSFSPLIGSWQSIETYFQTTLSYTYNGSTVTNRVAVHAADSSNTSLYTDGPLTGPRNGPASLPEFTLPPGATCTAAALTFLVTSTTIGTAQLIIGEVTLRDTTSLI